VVLPDLLHKLIELIDLCFQGGRGERPGFELIGEEFVDVTKV
jgi:hypothetical protein